MESGYVKANSSNLPRVDILMVGSYFASDNNFVASEFKNVKTSVSSRESYGDDAVGYVQLKREGTLCTVKCRVCPEHKVHAKPYAVTVVIEERDNAVQSAQCHDCAASAGGCKHAVAFLMWLHRRSEEPSCTQVSCYWKKSKLSKVGTSLKYILASELAKENHSGNVPTFDSNVLLKFVEEARKRKVTDCEVVKYQTNDYSVNNVENFSLHLLVLKYREPSSEAFIKKIKILSDDLIKQIELSTRNQNKNSLWYELRYARITASKAYEVSRCKTMEGSLVATIMGGRVPETAAMKRGCSLEDKIFQILQKKFGKKLSKCGLFISKDEPIIAGSPDGVYEQQFIIEIKCPISEDTYKNYVKNGIISKKCYAQVQVQMYVTGIKKCYFCVAHWEYEKNNVIEIINVSFDHDYVKSLISSLISFWKTNIYPLLIRVAEGYKSS